MDAAKIRNMLCAHNDGVYLLGAREHIGDIVAFLLEENKRLRDALERAALPARRQFSGNDTHRLDECRSIINEALRSVGDFK